MDVFVVPIGRDRYELYCEQPDAEAEQSGDSAPTGIVGRFTQRFKALLRAAEERQHHREPDDATQGWAGRIQDRLMAWVAERVAEQRLLWNLRGQRQAVIVYPQDMAFDEVITRVRQMLQRDYERHRRWLVVDTLGLIASGVVALVPGPNLLAYYFLFRVGGHWLSMRGAGQGIHRIDWSGRPCPPLDELREVAAMEPHAREHRVHDIAMRLRLQHFATFFQRVAVN